MTFKVGWHMRIWFGEVKPIQPICQCPFPVFFIFLDRLDWKLETVTTPHTGRSWSLFCPCLVCSDTEKKHCLTPDSSLLILSVFTLCTYAPAIIKVRMYSIVNRSMAGKSTCESAVLPESAHVPACKWVGMPDSPCESCSKHHSIPLPGKPLKYW